MVMSFLCLLFFYGTLQIIEASPNNWHSIAKNQISNADFKIKEAHNSLQEFWNNVTDFTRRKVVEDLSKAQEYLRDARWEFQAENYNSSLRQACNSLFYAARAEYRIYLNMTYLSLQEANETIQRIPWYLGKPWYAMDVLENATKIHDKNAIYDYFERDLYHPDVYQQYESTNYVVYQRMDNAIEELFSGEYSAYNLAIKAKGLAIGYQVEQQRIFTPIFMIVVVCLLLSFGLGLVLGVYRGHRVRKRISEWWSRRKERPQPTEEELSENERKYCLLIVEASGALVTALITIGAMVGAVLQYVKYVYMFIGYMLGFALPFVVSGILGFLTLLRGTKSQKTLLSSYKWTVCLFIAGWINFIFLLFLSRAYEEIIPGWYYALTIESILIQFSLSILISWLLVSYFQKK